METVRSDGRRILLTSRRHRKGLAPLAIAKGVVPIASEIRRSWLHLWAPRRLSWWIAVLFLLGSALFVLGAYLGNWPPSHGVWLRHPGTINGIFFVGSLYFTVAAYLQFLEAVNGDVADVGQPGMRRWHWFGWKPHNLGYIAAAVQLAGTVLFNVNTADSMISGLSVAQTDALVWAPNIVGCVCFLVASLSAYVEYGHGRLAIAARDISWWIVTVNLIGSVLFMVSALFSFDGPEPSSAKALWLANLYTLLGAVCFLVASYLLIPELFEDNPES